MKVGLVGPSYRDRSLPFDAQRSINLYPVVDETQQGKEVSAMQGTPGLLLFSTCGSGPIRGEYAASNGRGFAVSGNTLYEVSSTGVSTVRGTLITSASICSLDENGLQLAICDGLNLYIFTYATNAFVQVTDVDFPTGSTVCFIDGYFVVDVPNSGKFYISALYDGTSWDALDFATAESSPDNLVRVYQAVGQLWLFGTNTTEIWTNTGGSLFPFQRISGAKMETGCIAPHSVVALDNSIFWLGQDRKGDGIVYRANGFSPSRISTHAIEFALQQASDLSLIRGYTYQQDGHSFYVLTGVALNTTFVYDVSTQLWHERAYLNAQGFYETHLASTHMFIFGKNLVGDRLSGKIYDMSLSYFDDNGSPIKAQRTFAHLFNEGKGMKISELEVDFEGGVGLTTGQGSNPQVWLEISEDGARTWSPEYYASIGAIGNYLARAVWRKLGFAYQLTFRVSISDPVKRSICGAYLR